MKEPTREAIDELVGSATPHFAYQLRARVAELVQDLAPGDELRVYAEEQMALLDRLHDCRCGSHGDVEDAKGRN